MPIDYTYGNNGFAALLANRAGANQARRRDQEREFEELLRASQLAEQHRQFNISAAQRQQGIDLSQLNADRQFDYNIFRDMNAVAQRQQELANQNQQNAIGFERELYRARLGHELGQENLELQAQLQQDRDATQLAAQRETAEIQYSQQAAAAVDAEFKSLLSQYRKMPLSDEGKQRLHEFEARYRRLKGQQATYPQREWATAVGKLMNEFSESGIEDFATEPPTIESMIKNGQMWQDPTGAWWGVDHRNGEAIPKKLADAPETAIDTPMGIKMPAKDYFDVMRDLREQARAELTKKNPVDGSEIQPTPEEIQKRLQSIMGGLRDAMGGTGGTPSASLDAPPKVDPKELQSIVPRYSVEEIQQLVSENFVGYFAGPDGRIFYRNHQGKILREDSWGSTAN